MKIVSIILSHIEDRIQKDLIGDVIGVDYGAWFCIKNNIPMKFACGDFDSVTKSQKKDILKLDIPVHTLPTHKNMTDFEYALTLCDSYDLIYVFGGLNGRKDHEILNVKFAIADERIILVDKTNSIQTISKGEHLINKANYEYLSFIPMEASIITIEGVKYPLERQKVAVHDSYLTSNEIEKEQAYVQVHEGSFILIQSNDTTMK